MKISNYINLETTRLTLHTGIGYLCGSLVGLVTHSTHPILWKVVGIIVPIAHFALQNLIEGYGAKRKLKEYQICFLKDILKTAELAIATIVLAAIKFNEPVMTVCFVGLTILFGYEARQRYVKSIIIQSENQGVEMREINTIGAGGELQELVE